MIPLEEIEKSYNQYSGEIFSYILRSVYNHDAAEDILQDVFIKLISYSQKKEVHGKNIRALLYSIARSVCIDRARSLSKTGTESYNITDMPDLIPDRQNPDNDIIDAVNLVIDTLGEPEKSIILLRQNGLTYSEISKTMKIPERTLKRKTAKTIDLIRKELKEQGFFTNTGTDDSGKTFHY